MAASLVPGLLEGERPEEPGRELIDHRLAPGGPPPAAGDPLRTSARALIARYAADPAELEDLSARITAFRLSCCLERLKRAGRLEDVLIDGPFDPEGTVAVKLTESPRWSVSPCSFGRLRTGHTTLARIPRPPRASPAAEPALGTATPAAKQTFARFRAIDPGDASMPVPALTGRPRRSSHRTGLARGSLARSSSRAAVWSTEATSNHLLRLSRTVRPLPKPRSSWLAWPSVFVSDHLS